MLLVTRTGEERFDARFVMPVMFTPCLGARDDETVGKLASEATGPKCVPCGDDLNLSIDN